MKLALIVNKDFRAALEKLSKQPLPLRTAFKLKGAMKKINEEFMNFEEIRNEALQRLGQKDEDGKLIVQSNGGINLSQEAVMQFNAEISELANTDVEVQKVTIAELGENITLTTEELLYLEAMIDET